MGNSLERVPPEATGEQPPKAFKKEPRGVFGLESANVSAFSTVCPWGDLRRLPIG
jgi:hypothetical protein